MNRFFGMMPASEVQMCRRFKDGNNLTVTIEAGLKGWTIIWADNSTNYSDVDDTFENNFAKAYERAVDLVGPLKEVSE